MHLCRYAPKESRIGNTVHALPKTQTLFAKQPKTKVELGSAARAVAAAASARLIISRQNHSHQAAGGETPWCGCKRTNR